MKDAELNFDRERHLLYSKKTKGVIRKYLLRDYGPEQLEPLWEEVQRIYVGFLESVPYLGGKQNMQAGSVYNCIALFAYYEAVPNKPSLEQFEQMNDDIFVPANGKKKPVSLNWGWGMRAAHGIFSHISQNIWKHREDWPGNYHMEVEPFDPEIGVRYQFTTCPIADFARAHGYTHLMSAMCNPDYPMLGALHGGLIRTTTCANGPCCDYWIVGDKSEHLKRNPLIRDEAGYLRNEKEEPEC